MGIRSASGGLLWLFCREMLEQGFGALPEASPGLPVLLLQLLAGSFQLGREEEKLLRMRWEDGRSRQGLQKGGEADRSCHFLDINPAIETFCLPVVGAKIASLSKELKKLVFFQAFQLVFQGFQLLF